MNEIRELVVLDGALASELERDGYDLDDPLWSARTLIERPEAIVAVHRRYVEAGADIITTASYQATVPGLLRRGLSRADALDVLRTAGTLARQACDGAPRSVRVAGSLGPYGASLADGSEYRGAYGLSEHALVDFHRERAEIVSTTVDLLAFETIPDATEAKAIGRLLAEPGLPAWVSFSIASARTLRDGTPLAEAVQAVEGSERIFAIGVNCCPPTLVGDALSTLREATGRPLIVYPNSGEGWDARDHRWTGDALDEHGIFELAEGWMRQGASIIGGCCRTTPALTRQLVRLRDRLRRSV
jgi:homocysteine S-methyltransferase